MAEDDQDRQRELEAEREAEIQAELERVDQDPDDVQEGRENLGTPNAPSGQPRPEERDHDSDASTGDDGNRTDDAS